MHLAAVTGHSLIERTLGAPPLLNAARDAERTACPLVLFVLHAGRFGRLATMDKSVIAKLPGGKGLGC